MSEALQQELIDFMFLRRADGTLDVLECLKLWFGKSNNTDITIRNRFATYVASALRGDYNDWTATPQGSLALMILIDQFSRNVYRHSIAMFSGDTAARKIIDAGHDWLTVLKAEECIFVPCLILTHQENVEDQRLCLDFYHKLEPTLPSELHIFRTIFGEHARIIELCGSFPHRDHYYGRETSATGRKLMDNPKIRFDLPLICEEGNVRFGHDGKKLWEATHVAFDMLEHIDALVEQHRAKRRAEMDWLTPEKAAELREAFRKFDKDGNDFLDIAELGAVIKSTHRPYTTEELQAAVDSITGMPGSKGLTFEEFAGLLKNKQSTDIQEHLRARFRYFDVNESGNISFDELSACIRGLDELVTTAEIEEMMKKCDADANGVISYEEFLKMIPSVTKEPDPVSPVEALGVVNKTDFTVAAWDDDACSCKLVGKMDILDDCTLETFVRWVMLGLCCYMFLSF